MKTDTKLYNVFFPFWMLLLIPQAWLFVLPVNFIIDSLVLWMFTCVMKLEGKWLFYRKHILPIFACGILADLVGSAYMLILALGFRVCERGDELYLTLPAVVLSAVCIFLFNGYIVFRKQDKTIRWKAAWTFAIVTAPYTFLVPNAWLYGF